MSGDVMLGGRHILAASLPCNRLARPNFEGAIAQSEQLCNNFFTKMINPCAP